ncbi:hypothetical protein [Agromyces allii]|uniref:Uncharacterized protein n=1 Tax=Agromyces allii TaxID=393607 RepID=A0ABP5CH75_9MICO|nr:hypothetical protein [Agromyces allii]
MSKRPTATQRVAIRLIGWVLGLFSLLLFFGLVDLSVPLFYGSRPEFYANYLIETGWGVLFTFFVGLPMCVLGARPTWTSAALVVAAAGVAVAVAGLAAGQPGQLLISAVLLVAAAAVSMLDRGARVAESARSDVANDVPVVRDGFRERMPQLALALIALPPAIVYATGMIQAARSGMPAPDYTWDFDHYPVQAASALVIPLATAALAVRLPGWRAMTLLVASGTAWFGVISIVFPDHFGSWGVLWGWISVAWAVALGVLVLFARGLPRGRPAGAE